MEFTWAFSWILARNPCWCASGFYIALLIIFLDLTLKSEISKNCFKTISKDIPILFRNKNLLFRWNFLNNIHSPFIWNHSNGHIPGKKWLVQFLTLPLRLFLMAAISFSVELHSDLVSSNKSPFWSNWGIWVETDAVEIVPELDSEEFKPVGTFKISRLNRDECL